MNAAANGVTVSADLVLDTSGIGQFFGMGPEVPLVSNYESHQIGRVMGKTATAFPGLAGLDRAQVVSPPGADGGSAGRWLLGFASEENRFSPTPELPMPTLLPPDRKLVYPWLGWQWVEDDFREMRELNDMGRSEDIAED